MTVVEEVDLLIVIEVIVALLKSKNTVSKGVLNVHMYWHQNRAKIISTHNTECAIS